MEYRQIALINKNYIFTLMSNGKKHSALWLDAIQFKTLLNLHTTKKTTRKFNYNIPLILRCILHSVYKYWKKNHVSNILMRGLGDTKVYANTNPSYIETVT